MDPNLGAAIQHCGCAQGSGGGDMWQAHLVLPAGNTCWAESRREACAKPSWKMLLANWNVKNEMGGGHPREREQQSKTQKRAVRGMSWDQ